MNTERASAEHVEAVFARLANASLAMTARYLSHENPQTMAAVLLLVPQERAARVLERLPADMRATVLRSMAKNRPPLPAAMHVVAQVLETELLTSRPVPDGRQDEVRRIVELMAPDMRRAAEATLADETGRAEPGEANADPRPPAPMPFSPLPSTEKIQENRKADPSISYERLPMLELILDRLVRGMSTSHRGLTSEYLQVSLDWIMSCRFDEYVNSLPVPVMLSVFRFEAWKGRGLLVADASHIQMMVESLLGGRTGITPARGRPYSLIDRSVFELTTAAIAQDLAKAFSEVIDPVELKLERTETNARFAAVVPATDAIIVSRLRIDMEGSRGLCDLVLPYATLEPLREALLQSGVYVPKLHSPPKPEGQAA
jgi:hypothetical protein